MDYLNIDNIQRSKNGIEYHPLQPFLPANASVLFLGSFPPQRKRWCTKSFDIEAIITFCRHEGIAFFDTASAVRRLKDNASDAFLEVVEPTDIRALLQKVPLCQFVVTTGQKATETICQYFGIGDIPKINNSEPIPEVYNTAGHQVELYRLPSSSRAYPLSFDKKVTAYRKMFEKAGLL